MDSNHRCLGVGQKSSPLDHGISGAEAVGLEPTTELTSAPAFEAGSSSGRMTSIKLRWQDSNLHASP